MSHRKRRMLELRRRSLRGNRPGRRDRRGVLLMVVLSMLALFLLLGTAFLVSSQFYATTGKEAAKENRTENNPADLLERAMLQVLRDTNNPNSAVRYHSLLRDVYGSDGFVGNLAADPLAPRYAGSSGGAVDYGLTDGQLMDLYVVDRSTTEDNPDSNFVIKLERDPDGTTADFTLPAATDYYAGCLLTMLTGPAAGQTTRIVDYDLMPALSAPGLPVYRIRVMAFGNSDGSTIPADQTATLAGHAFMVNGRPHNGTGVGYNRLAATGTPRLNAVELLVDQSGTVPLDAWELALTPNGQFMNPFWYQDSNLGASVSNIGAMLGGGYQPFGYEASGDQQLYTSYEGPGGSDESYDAVDFQNMFLAHMPLTPRDMAGAITTAGSAPILEGQDAIVAFAGPSDTVRFDHENTIIPSFHRPALMNYWYQRIEGTPWLTDIIMDSSQRILALADPYNLNDIGSMGSPGNAIYDQIVALKRKISLRPIREDHPSFNGSNPVSENPFWEIVGPWDVDNDNDGINDSVWVDLGDAVQETENGRLYKPLYAFLIVDLDNRLNLNAHGSVDHFATTDFDPTLIATTSDNEQPYAGNLAGGDLQFLIDPSVTLWTSNVMPVGMGWGPGDVTLRSILSPTTQPRSGAFAANFTIGDPYFDDNARLFGGRPTTTLAGNANVPGSTNVGFESVIGRFGSQQITQRWTAGRTFNLANMNTREPTFAYEFNGYPETDALRAARLGAFVPPTAFATSPDMRSKYATGVDYTGQPVNEAVWDNVNPATMTGPVVPLVDDSTYETDLSMASRRGLPASSVASDPTFLGNDDAPFATSEMERILRAYDAETGTAPSRLWDVVDAFDPNKYVLTVASDPTQPSAVELALATANTSINRRQVTTDSYEIPVPADVVPSYITELGPDGAPGIAGIDDDQNGTVDDITEIGWPLARGLASGVYPNTGATQIRQQWPDDFESLTGKSVTDARIVDVLWFRIQRNRIDRNLAPFDPTDPVAVQILNNIAEQLLPPEVLAGYKMDINRPFGDGRDNNGNGIVDEPVEAGEPWVDLNGDGVWQPGEPFIDLDGDGLFYADKDEDGFIDRLATRDITGDGVIDNNDLEPVLDSLWEQQLGTPAYVDNVMSKDVTGNGKFLDANGNGVWDSGETIFRDDAHLARQLYARHLYVLMLLLTDEDYLAPYDPFDPSVRGFLRISARELTDDGRLSDNSQSDRAARREALRRYTCRQIAQWAVNCVDFRDSDACNTPFEFDTNPWDGWNCVNSQDGSVFPLDGDVATDENHQQVFDWDNIGADGHKLMTNPIPTLTDGIQVGNRLLPGDTTRDVVWGVERPELLISETLAFHDTRLEDRVTTEDKGDNYLSAPGASTDRPQDDDLDQRLEPRGSLFVEIYNPWSGDGPRAVELYRHGFSKHPNETNQEFIKTFDQDGNNVIDLNDTYHWADIDGDGTPETRLDIDGVLLDRLSNAAHVDPVSGKVRRSPVWRLIVVEEHPGYQVAGGQDRLQETRDDPQSHAGDVSSGNESDPHPLYDKEQVHAAVGANLPGVHTLAPTNMDWDDMYYYTAPHPSGGLVKSSAGTWQQRRTGVDNNVTTYNNPQNQPGSFDRLLFAKPYPYIEREYYFTTNDSPYRAYRKQTSGTFQTQDEWRAQTRTYHDLESEDLRMLYDELQVRIPFSYVALGRQERAPREMFSLTHRFVANVIDDDRRDVSISPILPGRYAVIGSSGAVYDNKVRDDRQRLRFVTTMGRNVGGTQDPKRSTPDTRHGLQIDATRRIELRPSSNPFSQQLVIDGNGGFDNRVPYIETDRGNELIAIGNETINMTAEVDGFRLRTNARVVAPTIAIPVEDMNVSEPAYGYGVRARELRQLEVDSGDEGQTWNPLAAEGEGGFTTQNSAGGEGDGRHFDTPFDDDPEFADAIQSGVNTETKYRVLHLQRLADPTLPWNPPPSYNIHDNATVGTVYDPGIPVNPYLTVDSGTVDLTIFNGTSSVNIGNPADVQFRSTERGLMSTRWANIAPRLSWFQDFFAWVRPVDLIDWNSLSTTWVPQEVKDLHRVNDNHFDYVLNHSLGFANIVFGDVYIRPELRAQLVEPVSQASIDPTDPGGPNGDGLEETMGTALGAPRPDGSIASTYPWLSWNNRPFVSENELLQVPAWSSAEMLRKFSTMNTLAAAGDQINGYDAGRPVTDAGGNLDAERTNAVRYLSMVAGFGHLLNMTQSTPAAATVEADINGNPVPVGAPHFHRILDYVHTPSRFVATDTLLNPVAFNKLGSDPANSIDNVVDLNDPRAGLAAPFNRVPDYREPGKVNLNTVVGQRLPGGTLPTLWSDVFDGLMHRVRDGDAVIGGSLASYGHFGPAWRDIVLSRRGYNDPLFAAGTATGVDRVELVLNNLSPTFFANPFRSPEAGDLVPIADLLDGSVDVSLLRSHPFRPGDGYAWGAPATDNNGNGLIGDAREAGISDGPALDSSIPGALVPLFSELCSTPAIDGTRNSAMHYMPLTRLDNLTTTRSGVFAVWVTVGYFEVLPAPDWDNDANVRQKFNNQAGGDATRGRALYNKVYPQGYQLGKEIGSETGDTDRHRAFYMIDRTRPVAFKPGEDVNVEGAILLRRRID